MRGLKEVLELNSFDVWFKSACQGKPSIEAYDLARCAWVEAQHRIIRMLND